MIVSHKVLSSVLTLGAAAWTLSGCADDPCVDDGVSAEICLAEQTGDDGIPAQTSTGTSSTLPRCSSAASNRQTSPVSASEKPMLARARPRASCRAACR